MSKDLSEQAAHYTIVEQAIDYIRSHAREQPGLAEIAASVNLSEAYLQRIFSEWAGISPKRFLQYLTKEQARRALVESKDVLTATLESGLSSPGRLHDLMVSCEAMTPGEIRQKGRGLVIDFGIASTPFGPALIAWTQRGICHLAFCDNTGGSKKTKEFTALWPQAVLQRNDLEARALSEKIFPSSPKPGRLHLLLRGTNFQIKVWEALLDIGPSQLISYSDLASLAGSPRAHRAIGTALAANSIGFLIPCHRVIRGTGEAGIYRWGTNRKMAMLSWESAQRDKELVKRD